MSDLPWDIMLEESAELKILWTQFHRLKIQENILLPEERDCSQSPMASGGPQVSQIPDFQGMPPPRYGCSSGSSEDCCPDKKTILLATNAEGCGGVV